MQFFSRKFILPFLTLLTCIINIFIKFCHLAPLFSNFILLFVVLSSACFYYLPPALYCFSSMKNGSISFLHLLTCTNHTILLDVMLQALILCFSFFTCLVLLIFITPSHKSNLIYSYKIIAVKIIIIKINIAKVYTVKVYIITKECNNVRVYITND